MERIKLRNYDGAALCGFLILPPLFTTGLSSLAEQSNTAAWLAALCAAILMLGLFLLMARLMANYEGKHIIDISAIVLGKPFGILYGLLLGAYFCFFTGIQIRESAELLKIYGLHMTPISVVVGLILLCALVMNLFGGRAVVKSAGAFFVLILAGIAFILLLGLSRYQPDRLVPLLGYGLPALARNSVETSSLFAPVAVLLLFAPAFSGRTAMRRSGVRALAIAAAAYVLLCLCFTMMFSPSIGAKLMSGVIEMGTSSYYNHFFYRFESFLLFLLIFSAAIGASVGLLIVRESVAAALRARRSKPLTLLCALPILFAIYLPANIVELTQGYLPVIRQYGVVFLAGIPLLILIAGAIKRMVSYEKS